MQIKNKLKKVEQTVEGEFKRVVDRPRKVLERFPTLFLLLVTAGIVLVLFGFEQTFAKIDLFENHPYVMIILGIAILIFTGRLYKVLDK